MVEEHILTDEDVLARVHDKRQQTLKASLGSTRIRLWPWKNLARSMPRIASLWSLVLDLFLAVLFAPWHGKAKYLNHACQKLHVRFMLLAGAGFAFLVHLGGHEHFAHVLWCGRWQRHTAEARVMLEVTNAHPTPARDPEVSASVSLLPQPSICAHVPTLYQAEQSRSSDYTRAMPARNFKLPAMCSGLLRILRACCRFLVGRSQGLSRDNIIMTLLVSPGQVWG